MSESLFTSQTPTGGNGADGGAAGITTAIGMQFAVNGSVSGIRFFATTTVTAGDTYTVELWQATSPTAGNRIGVATVAGSSVTPGAWNTVNFSSPVAVSTGNAYYAAVNNNHNQGRYVATSGFFASAGLTNGNISAWKDGTDPLGLGSLRNGTFKDNSAPNNFPNGSSGAASYFVDVIFDADSVITTILAGTLSALTGSFAADMDEPGVISGALPALTGALTAVELEPASLAGVLPALTGALAAVEVLEADLTGTLAGLVGSFAADVDEPGVLTGALPALTGSMTAVVLEHAAIAASLPALTGHLVAQLIPHAQLAGVLPALTGHLVGQVDLGAVALPLLGGSVIVRGLSGTAEVV